MNGVQPHRQNQLQITEIKDRMIGLVIEEADLMIEINLKGNQEDLMIRRRIRLAIKIGRWILLLK